MAMAQSTLASAPKEPEPLRAELLHADLPLFGTDKDKLQPIHFVDGESFGCASAFAFGDWRESSTEDWRQDWMRIGNYGVFHCAYILSTADSRDTLDKAKTKHSWMVKIDQLGDHALWAMQIGATLGSSYRLFRVPLQKGVIAQMDELQIICPKDWQRKGPQIDVWGTRYCAVESREDLIHFARQMDRKPPLAHWQKVDPEAKSEQ